jgi:hypothetical protein
MATVTRQKLSGSTDGKMIKVSATGTPGTVLHTAVAGTAAFDEVWIYAVNSSVSDEKLTIEFGGVASPDDLIEITIPAESGLTQVVPGALLQNSNVVAAFAGTTNVINIIGWVNNIV